MNNRKPTKADVDVTTHPAYQALCVQQVAESSALSARHAQQRVTLALRLRKGYQP